jgi:hypothetical protein
MSDFARHYFRNRGCFLFLQVLRWFTSLGSLVPTYEFSGTSYGFTVWGFPIRRSPDQCLLAAPRGLSQLCHVLHRHRLPRHPPCALSSLTIKFTQHTGLADRCPLFAFSYPRKPWRIRRFHVATPTHRPLVGPQLALGTHKIYSAL